MDHMCHAKILVVIHNKARAWFTFRLDPAAFPRKSIERTGLIRRPVAPQQR